MGNIADIENITKSLNDNPMFRLSLGSKELFHSNFLEFLWEQNPTAFLEMLKEIVTKEKDKNQLQDLIEKIDKNKEYLKLAREKEHFDICIFHNEGNKIVYDIIIENKVKSIPYKKQLDGYVDKITQKKQTPIYVLLSLAKNFVLKKEISESWNVVDYKALESAIESQYKDKSIYITDYCSLIKSLSELEDILAQNHDVQYSQTYNSLKEVRLHDLYLKQMGSIFIGELAEMIENRISKELIDFGDEDRNNDQNRLFLSSTMNNGKSTITASILKGQSFYTIQIEGDQYRHMYNSVGIAAKSRKPNSEKIDAKKLERKLKRIKYVLNFLKQEDQFKTKIQNVINKNYCRYGNDVVYRYKKYSDDMDLLNIMADDVTNIYDVLFSPKQK